MADNGRWFKLWTDALDDGHLDNLPIADFGRWAKFGTWLKKHGTEGKVSLSPPSRTLCSILQVGTFDELICALNVFPNVQIIQHGEKQNSHVTTETDTTVTVEVEWRNWKKYQGDYCGDRVKKFRAKKRQSVTLKKRGEEKRGEENKKRREVKNIYGEYHHVRLTEQEHQKLKERYNSKLEYWIEKLDKGIEKKGYKYKSHYLALIDWAENPLNHGKDEYL